MTEPVRVLHVTGPFASGYFGAFARLHDRGRFQVEVCSLAPSASPAEALLRASGVETHRISLRGPATYPLAWLRLVVLLLRARPDIVQTHLFVPSAVGLAAACVARVPVRILTRHHAEAHHRLGRRAHVIVDKLSARLAHRVIAHSEWTRGILRHEGVPAERVTVIPHGVDIERFDGRLSSAHRGAVGRPVVLTVGRLHVEKGQQVLLEAIPRLKAACPDLVVVMAGEGPNRHALERRAQELGLDNVRLVGHCGDVPALMRDADVVVVPSLEEAFGQVVVEAMLAGRPVVASAVGAIPEILEDEVTGVLVPAGDAEALAGSVCSLLSDPARGARLGERARAAAMERFSAERMVRAHEALYDASLRGGGVPT